METNSFAHKVGMTLCPPHFSYLEQRPSTEATWFEADTESLMVNQGRPFEVLQILRQEYPIAFHGSALNIGSPAGVRLDYLQRLRQLIDRFEPMIISDHLCWTGTTDLNFHGMLPLPLTEETAEIIVNNIDFVQTFLKRPLILENVSTYIGFKQSYITEWDFIGEISRRSGCGILLDLNNVFVNSHNYGLDPQYYINHIPLERVAQVHLSGPARYGNLLYGSHTNSVPEKVWDLLKMIAPRIRHLPICIEREGDIPDFKDFEDEVSKAADILENSYEFERSTTAL